MAIATLTHLTYWYPGRVEPALKAVGLAIEDGLTVVAGQSGGGKSTLLRLFNGLVPHFHGGRIAGSAEVVGRDVIATPTRDMARHVGFVFQDPELQTVYNVVDREVAFGLENTSGWKTPRCRDARLPVVSRKLCMRRGSRALPGERCGRSAEGSASGSHWRPPWP